MSFGSLVVIVLAGLGGPLLAITGRRRFVPVVIGEILAGVLICPEVLDGVDPANGTVALARSHPCHGYRDRRRRAGQPGICTLGVELLVARAETAGPLAVSSAAP